MGKLAIAGGEPLRKMPFTQWPQGGKEEARNLEAVLAGTGWGGQPFPGKFSLEFATKFAKLHTVKYAQCVSTGTVAIQAALKAIDIQPGDEVIAPAYTWEGTVGPVLLLNAIPVFVDVDPDTYCLDAKLIEKAITPKTKAILPVHLGMRFADMDEILRIAAKHNLKIIEDCAHAHGGAWKGKGAGSMAISAHSVSSRASSLLPAKAALLSPTIWSTWKRFRVTSTLAAPVLLTNFITASSASITVWENSRRPSCVGR